MIPECIAEFVVEAGSDHAHRKGGAHVADALADVIPDIGNFRCSRAALQIDEDRRNAGTCETAQIVEARRFLQRSLKALRHLLERLFDAGAQPCGLNDHGLYDE